MAASTTKHQTVKSLQRFFGTVNLAMDYLEEIDPNVKRAGLMRHKVAAVLPQDYQLLYEKRRDKSLATLDAFFSKASLLEASASDEPPTRDEPQPGMSTGGFACVTSVSSSSDTDDPDVANSLPPPPTPSLNLSKQGLHATFGECYCIIFVF